MEMLKKINAMAEFNRWCGIEVIVADPDLLKSRCPGVQRWGSIKATCMQA
jgi:hypothetical protein